MTKKLEPRQLLDRMRRSTAELLKYDVANLTPSQQVRLDRAAALRLELDDLQSKQLVGNAPFDMNKFVVASESLERILGGDPKGIAPDDDDGYGWRERLRTLLAGRLRAREQERDAVVKKLTEKFSNPRIHAAVEAAATVEPGERQVRLIEAAAEMEFLKTQIEQLQAELATPLLLTPPAEPPPVEEAAPAPWIDPNAGKPPPFIDGNPWSNKQ